MPLDDPPPLFPSSTPIDIIVLVAAGVIILVVPSLGPLVFVLGRIFFSILALGSRRPGGIWCCASL